jgi:hypothetical protein
MTNFAPVSTIMYQSAVQVSSTIKNSATVSVKFNWFVKNRRFSMEQPANALVKTNHSAVVSTITTDVFA